MIATRRARPLLGTLVEIGAWCDDDGRALEAAFAAIAEVQARLSRFESGSEVSRFHALPAGAAITLSDDGIAVLQAAAELQQASGGLFDVTQGSGPAGWCLQGRQLHKRSSGVRLDLGGIAKGHAVDRAVAALRSRGIASGWVNAGGDLCAFGDAELPVRLRDEAGGGVREFARLSDGAFATSLLAGRHVSVAAPSCLWADALTKVVALSGDASHPALAAHGARGFVH